MKILVADDSRVMRQIVIRTLRQAGYDDHDIVEAEDGADALAKVSSEQPGPRPVGLEHAQHDRHRVPAGAALLRLDRALRLRRPPRARPEMREKAANAGALFLIAKPFNEDTFKDALDGVIA